MENITQSDANTLNKRDQALNGWIAIDAAGVATATGKFSGIKVLQGAAATIALTFDAESRCKVNGVTITLVEGDYIPTPGLISVTISAGKCLLINE